MIARAHSSAQCWYLWTQSAFDDDLQADLVEAHESKRQAGEERRKTDENKGGKKRGG